MTVSNTGARVLCNSVEKRQPKHATTTLMHRRTRQGTGLCMNERASNVERAGRD